MKTIELLIGVNWRTTVSGTGAALFWLLTLLAGLPAQLGAAFALFPAEWKGRITITAAISAAILQTIHAAVGKDSRVTGNGTIYEPAKVAESDGSNRTIAPAILALLALPFLALNSCAWIQAHPETVAVVKTTAKDLVSDFLLSAATTEFDGGKFDSAWAISTGLNSIASEVAKLPNQAAANLISQTATKFAGDPSMATLSKKLAGAYLQANPQTPQAKTAAVAKLSSDVQAGIDAASNALP